MHLTFLSYLLSLLTKTTDYVLGFFHRGKFAGSPLVKILLAHSYYLLQVTQLNAGNNQIIDLWMLCAVKKPYLLILANLQSNKRQKKETIRFSLITCISLNVKFSIPTKNLEIFFTFFSFLDQSPCMKS